MSSCKYMFLLPERMSPQVYRLDLEQLCEPLELTALEAVLIFTVEHGAEVTYPLLVQ